MIDLLGYLFAFATGGGLAILTTSIIRTPRHADPTPPTDCHHIWDGWTDPEYKPLHGEVDGETGIIGRILQQQRTCITCGYIEYRQETFKH